MKEIFPPEIIEYSVESNFARNNKKTRIIYSIVIMALLCLSASLPLIYVDISTQSRGIVRAKLDNNQLIPAVYSRIEWMNISENQMVRKGDTLMILNSEKIENQIRLNEYLIAENQKYISDLQQLINGSSYISTPKYRTEYAEFQQQKKDYQTRIIRAKYEYDLAKDLFDLKVGIKTDYDQKKYAYELELSALKVFEEQHRNSWQNTMSQLVISNSEYQSQIGQTKEELRLNYIIAPITGTITNFSGLQKGNFVVPNQAIAYISPIDDLLVECYVSPSDIGYIKPNMITVFQIDAFNYNQWGLGRGHVQEISDDIININEKPYFKVRCSIDNKCLKLKNGYSGRIKKGMTLTGRFQINRRSLFQLLYDKADNWLNPKMFAEVH
jgi:multidrug resistance efflux pump